MFQKCTFGTQAALVVATNVQLEERTAAHELVEFRLSGGGALMRVGGVYNT